jgi:hypothetical protein
VTLPNERAAGIARAIAARKRAETLGSPARTELAKVRREARTLPCPKCGKVATLTKWGQSQGLCESCQIERRNEYRRAVKFLRPCLICGELFVGRFDAKTCSPKCRQHLKRHPVSDEELERWRVARTTAYCDAPDT